MDTLIELAPLVGELPEQTVATSDPRPRDAEERYVGFVESARRLEGIGGGLPPDSEFARRCYRFAGLCYQAAMELLESDDPRRSDVRARAQDCFLKTLPRDLSQPTPGRRG